MPETALRTDADFEAFYERHWKYVYRLCFAYLQNEADAEDVTEDIFVQAWQEAAATRSDRYTILNETDLSDTRLKEIYKRMEESFT